MDSNYVIYFFDIDGTLAESKRSVNGKIPKLLSDLSQKNKIALLSGASFDQIVNQVLYKCPGINLDNVFILPTSGASLFVYKENTWVQIYKNTIDKKYITKVQLEITKAFEHCNVPMPPKHYGPRLHYRGSQITFSAFGQDAPTRIKSSWDPTGSKRKKIVSELKKKLRKFEISAGGTNSIDINLKGIDKAYGIEKLCEYLEVRPEQCVFVGDAIFVGGNDYAVTKTSINTILTADPKQTQEIIQEFLTTPSKKTKPTQIQSQKSFFDLIRDFVFSIVRFIKNIGKLFFGKKTLTKKKKPSLYDARKKMYVTRSHKNPILSPTSYSWENEGVFNPAAIYLDGKVHLLYRALGSNGMSTIGYASSEDGIHFDERLTYPIYYPTTDFELNKNETQKIYNPDKYTSGGGWTGCEDPKICKIGDRLFLTYVAFCGWDSIRVAMSSISVSDFLDKKWNWTIPILCSPAGVISKSGGLFPEKIKNKYVFFQRIFPDIMLDYLQDLRFADKELPSGVYRIKPSENGWDSRKVSFGATPIKTKYGWLVITHGVDDKDDSKYHMGAMILDINHPERVLYRSRKPLLSPELWYENDWKPGIVYPCGAVNKDGTLLVYYGGGDKYVCVASALIDDLLEALIADREFQLKEQKIIN